MKRLACLCALLFAGHTMAAGTCSDATFSGTYVFGASGTFLEAAPYVANGQATSNGDGTGTLRMDYSVAGVSTNVTENFTYSIDANCHLVAHANLAGIPATFAGNITRSGNLMYFTTTLTGTSIHGRADKDQ